MAEYNMTDKEQVEMIKKWWKDYGRVIAVAVVIGLVVAFGWRYWRRHNIEATQHASNLYEKLDIAASQQHPKVAEKIAAQLMQKYRRTPYATMAALWWAKALVSDKNYLGALQKTRWVLDHSRINSFKQIARLRTARILLYQKKLGAALNALKTVDDKTYQPLIDEVKGDIYMAMKKTDSAAKAYKAAQSNTKAAGVSNPILDMKTAI